MVNHHRVIDHQINGGQRIDLFWIAAHGDHGLTHGGQIDHCRNARKILHQHTGWSIGDFLIRTLVLQPGRHGLDVIGGDAAAIFVAQQVLQKNL